MAGDGAIASVLMPRSPMWVLPASGALLIIADRVRARSAERSDAVVSQG